MCIRGNILKKSRALLIIVSIVALIAIGFIAMPFVFIGAPSLLFSIYNNDSNEHKVVIEIFDSNNESVFEQTYELAPEASISQPKPTWLLLELSIPSGDTKEYTFKTILNNNVTDTRQIGLQVWSMADIVLYENGTETPLSVYEMVV